MDNYQKSNVYTRDNEYIVSRRDMATPYYKMYVEARNQRAARGTPNYGKKPKSYSGYNDDYSSGAQSAPKAKTGGSAKKARRGFFVALVAVFMLIYIAVLVLNYVNLEALGDANKYLSLFNKVELVDAEAADEGEEEAEEVAEAAAEDDEAEADEEAEAEEVDTTGKVVKITQTIGVEDILMSFIASFVNKEEAPADEAVDGEEEEETDVDTDQDADAEANTEEGEKSESGIDASKYAFYNDCMLGIKDAKTLNKIAYYALPIVLVLGAIIAIIFFIRALIALFTSKRRKLFILSSVLLLVLNIVGIVCGFIWSGAEWSNIMNFTPFGDGTVTLQVGYGYIILTGISLLTLIASLFAFRSKKSLA